MVLSNRTYLCFRYAVLESRRDDLPYMKKSDTSQLTAGLGVIRTRRSMSILQNLKTIYTYENTLYNKINVNI